jgi:L-rhamnose mutarotase
MLRFGQVIGVDPSRIAEYRRYHEKIWPEIEAAQARAGIQNYSIFLFQDKLFGYYEYVGPVEEYGARMQELAKAPRMREWWDIMEPMQRPVEGRKPGEWWANMEEVFHR